MPPVPKFPGLAQLIKEAAPALARESAESVAAKTMTAEEKAYLDMIKQQMAEQEAFKGEFNLPTAHGTSGEKIAQHMDILDYLNLEKELKNKLGLDFIPRSEIANKAPDLTIKEFKPNEALNGMGIYSHPYDPKQESYLGPNYKANEFTRGTGSQIIPLRVRGNKTFNFDNNIHHSVSDKVLTRNESFEKLSELTGTPVDELKQLSAYDIEKLARRYPDQFENITFQGQIKTFKPESLRGEFAEYDPLKRKSGDYMSGLAAATGLGATALGSSEAKANELVKQLAETKRKLLADPRRIYTRSDQLYPDPKFRPDYVDPSMEKPVYQGLLGGGAEESAISPIDFITPGMVVAPAKALGKGAVALAKSEAAKDLGKSFLKVMADESGELTLPQMRAIAKLMGKNPTEQQLREAAEIVTPKNILEKETAREGEQDLLDFVAKERHGIEHSTPGEQIIEKMQKIYEPQLPKGTGVPVVINPEIIKEGVSGRLTFKNPRQNYSRIPEIVEIGDPNERVAGLFEHEKVGHEVDMLTNPFVKYQEELVPTALDELREITNAFARKPPTSLETFLARVNSFKLRDKLVELLNVDQSEAQKIIENLGLNKYLEPEQAQQQGSNLLDFIKDINKGISFEDISKTGHHWRYPKNFEVQRSLDLLNPNIPVAGPDLTENLRIIKEIAESNPIGLIDAYRLYKQKNFPNIAELLKGRNRFELFPVDPNTGKYIFKE